MHICRKQLNGVVDRDLITLFRTYYPKHFHHPSSAMTRQRPLPPPHTPHHLRPIPILWGPQPPMVPVATGKWRGNNINNNNKESRRRMKSAAAANKGEEVEGDACTVRENKIYTF